MTRARATAIFIVAPSLVLAASILGALGTAGPASRIVSAVLALASIALIVWGTTFVRRLLKAH